MQIFNSSLENNIGKMDKALRSTVAASMITSAFSDKISTTGKVLLFIGAGILLATSISGKCPLYQATGIDTRNYNK